MTPNEIKALSRNIPLIYTLNGFWAFMIIMPVIVPFFQSRGLSMSEIYQIQAVFGFALLLFEVPSGYISDLFGRKTSLIWACLLHGIGYFFLVYSTDFLTILASEIVLALAVSLMSGTDVSVIYDSQLAIGSKKAPIKMVGRKVFYLQTGEALGGLLGGFLILFSMNGPIVGQAIVAWLPLCVVAFIKEPPRSSLDKKAHKENFLFVFRTLFVESKTLRLILLTSMFYGVSTLVAVWGFQKYWQEIQIPLSYFGYLWAISNFTVAVTGRFAHKIEVMVGSSVTLVAMALLPVVGFLGVGYVDGVLGVIFCLCFQMSRGLNAVVMRDALNRRIGSELRATANSISSLGVRGLFILIGPIFGAMMDTSGAAKSFAGLGWIYAGLFFVIVLPLLRQRREFQGADELRRAKKSMSQGN